MKKGMGLLAVAGVVLGLCATAFCAEEPKTQTKTGKVTSVDAEHKTVTVMVQRDLTFTVNDATKIMKGDQVKTLADIKVGDGVTVEYTRQGQVRTATKITING